MRVSTRVKRISCAAGVSAAMAMVASGAHVSAQGAVINACLGTGGSVRIITGGDTCRPREDPISWNVQGSTGPAGPLGPMGPAGPEGLAGRDGRDGRDSEAPPPTTPTVIGQLQIDGLSGIAPVAVTPIFSFGTQATNTGGVVFGGGGGTGKVDFSDFVVTKPLDAFSAPLLNAAATGNHLRSVQIEIFAVGSTTPFATYTLEDAVITSDAFSSSPTGVVENVSFSYRLIRATIVLGGVTYASCYDRVALKPC